MSPLARRTCVLWVVAGLVFPVGAGADDAAVLYQPADVAQLDLTLTDEAEQALLDDSSSYVAATFALTVGDLAFGPKQVEVKLKGHGSFRPLGEKAAFKVKFAKTDRLLGLKSLTLNNMVQDPSMLHEALGYEALRAAGVPAPRTGFAYVRVNRQGYGLYLNLETYDTVSLARLFGTTQHLYEADDPGVDVTPGGAGAYEVDEGDEDDRTDLEALITAANATAADWSTGMAGSADLDEMTRMWAGEQYLGHWVGYSVTAGPFRPNNYYLHSDATGRFSMLPVGLDQTFQRRDAFPGTGDGLLIGRCLADAWCLQAFRSNLGAVAAAADGMGIGARLDALAATVGPWRPCPDLEHAGDSAWQAAVTGTRAFIRDRRRAVATYLGAGTPVTDPALESTEPPRLSAGCPALPDPPPDEPKPPPETPGPPPAGGHRAPVPIAPASAATGSRNVTVRARRLLPLRLIARVSPATDARPPYRFTTSGSLVPPAGLRRASACGGRVAVRVKAGPRTVSLRRAFLRRDCTFSSSVSFTRPSRLAGARKLTVQARFAGNRSLLPRSAAARTVTVRAALARPAHPGWQSFGTR